MLRGGKKIIKLTYICISRVHPEQSDISWCLHAEPAKTFERDHAGAPTALKISESHLTFAGALESRRESYQHSAKRRKSDHK